MSLLSRLCTAAALAVLIAGPSTASAADKWVTPGFAPGWKNYGQTFRPVSAVKSGNVVTVSGLAARTSGKWGHIATLPSDMRPKKRLVFNLNTHERTARVDVLPNGQIQFVTGQTAHNWVSLDGISFITGKTNPLNLTAGWQNYSGGYATANTLKVGNTITLGGLVKPGAGNVIATLPAHLRPAKRHIFNLNSHDKTSRVDVLPNGQVIWVYRAPARGWVSLDGIRFERKPGRALQMVNGWKNYQDGYAAATATRIGNRISVNGLLRAGRWGHMANLPKGMCPEKQLIFNLNNDKYTARVDVYPDCRIVWLAGGRDFGWLSLEGISFVIGKPTGAQIASAPKTPVKSSPLSWAKVPGGATDIAVGANGAVWIVGGNRKKTGNDIYQYVGHNKWRRMPGAATRIAVDPKGNAWIVDRNRKIHRWDGGAWQTVPGGAHDIAVGANGTVWVIGADKRSGGFTIWRYLGNNKWKNVPGDAARIAVDPKGNAWVVNTRKEIFRHDGRKWNLMPGGAIDIGIGANGAVWVIGSDHAPYQWNGKTWQKHTGAITGISVGPKGYPWAVNGAKSIYADRRSPSHRKPPKPPTGGGISSTGKTGNTGGGLQTGAPPSDSYTANDNKMISSADTLIRKLKIPVIKDQWNTWKNKFRKDGTLLKLDVRLFNQSATIVIYRPRGKTKTTDKVNVAVLVDNFKISNLIKPTANTVADDLRVNKVTYIFVPQGNEENINTSALPKIIRASVENVRTGPIVIVGGQNMFGIVNNADNGPTAKFLKQINLPLGNLKVNAAYGHKKSKVNGKTDPYNGVRLTRAGTWNKPFHLKDTKLTNPTFEYVKLGNEKTFRAWGTASLKDKPYFMFLQKQGKKGAWPTAAALDTSSISMVDYVNIATVFSNTIFNGLSYYQNLTALTNHLPLNAVEIENPRYDRGKAVDADNNPVFTNVMIMAANAKDTPPDAKQTKGAVLIAHGKGKVLGVSVARIDAQIYKSAQKSTELDVKANVDLPNLVGMKLGKFDFALFKNGNAFAMELSGRTKVTFENKKIIDEKIVMKVDKTGLTYNLGASCPLRPLGVDISINTLKLTSSSNFNVAFKSANPLACILGPLGEALDLAKGAWNTTEKLITSYSPEKFSDASYGLGKTAVNFLEKNDASKAVRDKFDDAWGKSGAGSAAKKIVKKAKFW